MGEQTINSLAEGVINPIIKPLAEIAIYRDETNQSTIWQKSPSIKAQAEVAIHQYHRQKSPSIKPQAKDAISNHRLKLPLIGIKPINQTLWQKSPPVNQHKVHSSIWTVRPLSLFLFCSFFIIFCIIFLKIPNFCLDRPFGFSIHREYIFFVWP